MDRSEEPLIAGDRHYDQRQDEGDDSDAGGTGETNKTLASGPGVFVVMLTFAAGISGLLFGCMIFTWNAEHDGFFYC